MGHAESVLIWTGEINISVALPARGSLAKMILRPPEQRP